MSTPSRDADDWASTLFRVSRDRRARRELLWLLAMTKADHETAADLERVDARVVERIVASGLPLPVGPPPPPESFSAHRAWHSERYGALADAWFERARARVGDTEEPLPPVV